MSTSSRFRLLAALTLCAVLAAGCGSGGGGSSSTTASTTATTSTVSGTVVSATGKQMQLVDPKGFEHTLDYGTPSLASTAEHYLATQGPVRVVVHGSGTSGTVTAIGAGTNPFAGLPYHDGVLTAVSATAVTLRPDSGAAVSFVVTAKNLTAMNIPALHNDNLAHHTRTRIYYVKAGADLDARGYLNLG